MVDKTIEDAQARVNPYYPYDSQEEYNAVADAADAEQNAMLVRDLRAIEDVECHDLRIIYKTALTSSSHDTARLVQLLMRRHVLEYRKSMGEK